MIRNSIFSCRVNASPPVDIFDPHPVRFLQVAPGPVEGRLGVASGGDKGLFQFAMGRAGLGEFRHQDFDDFVGVRAGGAEDVKDVADDQRGFAS